ncbi:MAG: ABC transporter ATP-binding protein [Caldilineaceae bacterium]
MSTQSLNHSTSYISLLRDYLRPHWIAMLLLALLLFGDIGLQLWAPQIVRTFIDTATAGGALRQLLWLAGAALGVTLLQQAMAIGAAYLGDNVGWRATNRLRTDLFAHCLGLNLRFHQRHTPGAMIERIDSDVGVLSNFLSRFSLLVVGNLLLLLGVLALLYRENWRLGLLFTLFAGLAIYAIRLVEGKAAPYWEKAFGASAELYGFMEERLSGLDDLRTNGAVPAMLQRFYQIQRRFFHDGRNARFAGFVIGSALEVVLSTGTLGALALGVYLYQRGTLTLGGVYLITQYSRLILHPLGVLSEQVDDLQRVRAGLTRVNELWRTPHSLTDGHRELPAQGSLAVTFDNVTFAYPRLFNDEMAKDTAPPPDEAAALQQLSFHLAPGRVLGLLGRTGSGKTTLTRLLFRFYDPNCGEIRLDGTPLSDLKVADLRSRIGLVTQEVQLFAGTLRENLAFFDDQIPDDSILAALRALGLDQWLTRFPAGLDTRLGSGGQGVSAGEAQLIAFTRVLLKDVGLVILDEASSRLDPVTERLMEQAIDRLLQGRTGIIIAHRLATVQRVDDILILEQGRIREQGDRQTLAADSNSYYAHLLTTDLAEVLT